LEWVSDRTRCPVPSVRTACKTPSAQPSRHPARTQPMRGCACGLLSTNGRRRAHPMMMFDDMCCAPVKTWSCRGVLGALARGRRLLGVKPCARAQARRKRKDSRLSDDDGIRGQGEALGELVQRRAGGGADCGGRTARRGRRWCVCEGGGSPARETSLTPRPKRACHSLPLYPPPTSRVLYSRTARIAAKTVAETAEPLNGLLRLAEAEVQGRLSELIIARQTQWGLSTSSTAGSLPTFYKRVRLPGSGAGGTRPWATAWKCLIDARAGTGRGCTDCAAACTGLHLRRGQQGGAAALPPGATRGCGGSACPIHGARAAPENGCG